MNSYTHAIDSLEYNGYNALQKIDSVVLSGKLTLNNYEFGVVITREEWNNFWILFACLIAELDQEDADILVADIIQHNNAWFKLLQDGVEK